MASQVMIIQPTGDKRGHYGVFTSKLAQAFVRSGQTVVIVTNRVDMAPYGGKPEGVEIVEVGDGKFAFDESPAGKKRYWQQYFRNSFLVTKAGLSLAKKRGIKGIYISDSEFLMASLLLLTMPDCARRILMQVNAANFSYKDYRSANRLKKAYKAFQTTIFRRALNTRIAGINALGEWHARRLRQQLQLGQEYPILVVPDGADLSDAPIDRGEARLRLGLAQDDVLFLAFGNFRRDKDYPTLFSALAGVKSTRIKLMLVGHLAEYSQEELDGLIDAADVRQKIAVMHTQFASPQQVREFFSACDVLILPYGRLYTDGSGPLRKEAATYARAVLASDVAEMGDLLRVHNLGKVYPAGDPAALAVAMDEFASLSPTIRDSWGQNCRNLGAINSWTAMAEKFSAFFNGSKA